MHYPEIFLTSEIDRAQCVIDEEIGENDPEQFDNRFQFNLF